MDLQVLLLRKKYEASSHQLNIMVHLDWHLFLSGEAYSNQLNLEGRNASKRSFPYSRGSPRWSFLVLSFGYFSMSLARTQVSSSAREQSPLPFGSASLKWVARSFSPASFFSPNGLKIPSKALKSSVGPFWTFPGMVLSN